MNAPSLSPDQRTMLDAMCAFARGEIRGGRGGDGIFCCGGVAGSGKTTTLGAFAKVAHERRLLVAYVAFTGRASSVLARSLRAADVPIAQAARNDQNDLYDDAPRADDQRAFSGTMHRLVHKPIVNERGELRGFRDRLRLDRDYGLIVIDEASMVSDAMLAKVRAFGVPILAVGDHAQLPPVMASGNLMQAPDVRLEMIHRQAESNPIIAISRHVREGAKLSRFSTDDPRVTFRWRCEARSVVSSAYAGPHGPVDPLDVGILAWTNRQRIDLNWMARSARGARGDPLSSEVLICLRNLRDAPIFNGMRGVLSESARVDGEQPWRMQTRLSFPEEGVAEHQRSICGPQLNRPRPFEAVDELYAAIRGSRWARPDGTDLDLWKMSDSGDLFDFGYALTVHKSQGSQFGHVVLYCDRPEDGSEDARRFYYTAVTRAQDRLTVLV